jgi:hypothetical protein
MSSDTLVSTWLLSAGTRLHLSSSSTSLAVILSSSSGGPHRRSLSSTCRRHAPALDIIPRQLVINALWLASSTLRPRHRAECAATTSPTTTTRAHHRQAPSSRHVQPLVTALDITAVGNNGTNNQLGQLSRFHNCFYYVIFFALTFY